MMPVFIRFIFILTFSGLTAGTSLLAATPPFSPESEKSLEFVRNQNQWDASVKFRAALPGGFVDLKQNQLLYNFIDQAELAKYDPHHAKAEEVKTGNIGAHAYTVTFLKANKTSEITPESPTPGYRNYFLGDDPAQWASGVKAYRQAQYRNLYSGISAKFYEHEGRFKYDFILAPKASPAAIKMQYDGADKLYLENGNLVIQTSVNKVTEQKPYAYQRIKGKEVAVPCAFLLEGNVVSFIFPKGYNRSQPLIIDPTLIFSSYTGATDDNWGFTATYDNEGNLYSGGITFSYPNTSFPVSPGAYQSFKGGNVDIAIIKYNPNASGQASRVYATYLGGNQVEAPHSLVVNSQNELLILGTTGSGNFPKNNAVPVFDNTFNGGSLIDPFGNGSIIYSQGTDLFVSKLNAAGTSLLATTYLGGGGNDGLTRLTSPLVRNYGDQFRGDIVTDANDNVYIASTSSSVNFPNQNGYGGGYSGGLSEGVVVKLSPNLSTLFWSNFIGGNADDAAYSIQVGTNSEVYVCGGTTSPNLPQTAGGFKPNFTFGPDQVEGFACRIDSTGTALRQTTYIGISPGYDQTYFLQLDAFNNVYLLGQSAGIYPVVAAPGAPAIYSSANGRQFIQKLTPDLKNGIFSTRFGSPSGLFNISPSAFLVDNCERIFVCGWGGSINAPSLNPNIHYVGGSTLGLQVTPNALRAVTDGSDFYLMQLSQNAAKLDYATFMGALSNTSHEHVDGGTSRFDKRGFIYQAVCAGCPGSSAFPTTPNAWSKNNNSQNCNNAAFKFDFAVSSAIVGATQTVCANAGPTQITGASPAGGVWSGTAVTPGGIFTPSPALVGDSIDLTYTVTIGTCVTFATKKIIVVAPPQISFTGFKPDNYCINNSPVTLTGSITGGVFSGPGIINGNQWSPAVAGPGKHVVLYSYKDLNGCTATATDTVTVPPPVPVSAGPDEGLCAGSDPITLEGATPAGGTWTGPGITPGTNIFTPDISLTGKQTITYTYQDNNCIYSDTKIVSVDPAPEVVTNLEFGNCSNSDSLATGYTPLSVKFNNYSIIGKSYTWDFGDGTSSSEASPEHTYTRPGSYTVTLTTDFGRSCIRTSTVVSVTAIESKLPNIITPDGDGKNDTFLPKVSCKPQNLKIYNRWGKLIYDRNDYISEFKGENLSGGTYYYLLKDTDNRSWKGWLEIKK